MLAVLLYKKYKVRLSRKELESLLGMLYWYLREQEKAETTRVLSLGELAQIQQAIKLGQRLQQRLLNVEQNNFKISLNLQEATTLEGILRQLPLDDQHPFERMIAYRINEVLTR